MKNKNEFKKIEKILYDYKYIDNKLDVFRFKLEHIKNDVNISSIDYSKDKISSTNAFNSTVENAMLDRESNIAALEEKIRELEYNKQLIDKSLTVLEDTELKLVKLRYFSKDKMTWIAIGHELGFDKDYCMKLRNKIINNKLMDLISF